MGTDRPESSEWWTSVNRLVTVMATDDRRAVVEYLQASERDDASLSELVESLAAREDQPDDRDQLAITLHHASLPKLAALDVLHYDAETKTVRYDGHPRVHELLADDANPLVEVS
jgi:hypothetical protein